MTRGLITKSEINVSKMCKRRFVHLFGRSGYAKKSMSALREFERRSVLFLNIIISGIVFTKFSITSLLNCFSHNIIFMRYCTSRRRDNDLIYPTSDQVQNIFTSEKY